jgi:pimeloyl-ACP methyl ester carboxylesterase
VSATDRLYLAAGMPTLIVWGEADPIIPRGHGRRAHAAMPGSRLVEIEGAGHFPHLDAPRRFAEILEEFIEETEPFEHDWEHIRRLVLEGSKTPTD